MDRLFAPCKRKTLELAHPPLTELLVNTPPHQGIPGNQLPSPSVSRHPSRRDFLTLSGTGILAALRSSCSRDLGIDFSTLHFASLAEVAQLIEAKQVSPVELTQVMLDRITAVDARLKSYATVMADQAMAAAREAEQEIQDGNYRGPLHGIPVAVKDLCYTKGVRTMGGLAVLADFVPDHDATVVSKLTKAGAVMLGKLNLTEGATAGYHRDFDIPVNPWGEDLWAGVSSSGSGVATAAGLCFASLGTDTGGSIRFPAAANGIVGLKPTYGRVSRYGVLPLAESLDHVGPMTRRTEDAAIVFEAIAGFDPNDPTSLREPVPSMLDELEGGVDGLRIGFDQQYAGRINDPDLVASIEEALGALENQGAQIIDVTMPEVPDVLFTLLQVEASRAHQENYPSRADEYGAYFGGVLAGGTEVTEDQYVEASAVRTEFSERFQAMMSTVDALASPAGRVPFVVSKELQYGDLIPLREKLQFPWWYTFPANLARTPTLSLPCGFSEAGLPHTIQFMGNRLSEPLLCRIGHAYEEATAWHNRHPNV